MKTSSSKEVDMKVTRENYKQFKYLYDYRNEALEALTDNELEAQKFYLTDFYKGQVGPLGVLKKIALRSIGNEKRRRKLV